MNCIQVNIGTVSDTLQELGANKFLMFTAIFREDMVASDLWKTKLLIITTYYHSTPAGSHPILGDQFLELFRPSHPRILKDIGTNNLGPSIRKEKEP